LADQLLKGVSATQMDVKPVVLPPRFEVNLVDRHGLASIVITNHGTVCHTFLGMPTELAILLRATQDLAWSVQDALRDFLKHHGEAFPIYFDTSHGRYLVEWGPSLTYTIKTEFDLRDGEVRVAARCVRFGVAQEHAQLFMGMVVDLDSYKLAPLGNDLGWTLYDLLAARLNEMLARGEIDLGFVSSHEYGMRPECYEILEDLSISAHGSVGSVFLFSRIKPEMLSGQTVFSESWLEL